VIFQLQDLDKAGSELLAGECRSCGWWQGHDDGWEHREAESWADSALETFGGWGKLAISDDELMGMIQYGPAGLFARAGSFACGPVSSTAVLLTCGFVTGVGFEPIRKSLVMAALAELKERGVETVEAFAPRDESATGECRFLDAGFLDDCGFYAVRGSSGLQLMRFELGGTLPSKAPRQKTRRRILERIKRASATPAPAAMCEAADSAGRVTICS